MVVATCFLLRWVVESFRFRRLQLLQILVLQNCYYQHYYSPIAQLNFSIGLGKFELVTEIIVVAARSVAPLTSFALVIAELAKIKLRVFLSRLAFFVRITRI